MTVIEMSQSNHTQNPYQSTTTLIIESRNPNFKYLLSLSGLIKIVCLMCELISNIFILVELREMPGSVLCFFCMTVTALIGTTLFLLIHVSKFHCIYHDSCSTIEVVYSIVASILFVLSSGFLLGERLLIGAFGIIVAFGYGTDAFLVYKAPKSEPTSDVD